MSVKNRYLIFVSHKKEDLKIAEVVKEYLQQMECICSLKNRSKDYRNVGRNWMTSGILEEFFADYAIAGIGKLSLLIP